MAEEGEMEVDHEMLLSMSLDDIVEANRQKKDKKSTQPKSKPQRRPSARSEEENVASNNRSGVKAQFLQPAANGGGRPRETRTIEGPARSGAWQQKPRPSAGPDGDVWSRDMFDPNATAPPRAQQRGSDRAGPMRSTPRKEFRVQSSQPYPAAEERPPAVIAKTNILARLGTVPGPGTGTQIIVSNLNPDIDDADMEDLFSTVGKLNSAEVRTGKNGRSIGEAVVTFAKLADAKKAVETLHNRTLDGTPMQIKLVETLSSSQQASRDEAARKRAQAVALANASGGPSWHAAPAGPSSRIVQRNGFQDTEDRFGAGEDEDSQPARGRGFGGDKPSGIRGRGATGKRDIVPVRAPEDELPRRRKPSEVDFEADTASPTAARGRGGRQGAGRGQGRREGGGGRGQGRAEITESSLDDAMDTYMGRS